MKPRLKHRWQHQCRVPEEKSGFCFCKSSHKFLYENYPKSQNYCYSRTINPIINQVKSREFIRFVDDLTVLEERDLLHRYPNQSLKTARKPF